jgi:flagellar basal-body rod protein FlgC
VSMFGVLPIAASGADAMQTWIDTAGGNIANMDDAVSMTQPAYAEQTPILAPAGNLAPGTPAQGVAVTSVQLGDTTGIVSDEPGSPLANATGEVKLPDVSMSDQLTGMIEAQENYQADTVVMQRAQTAYSAGLAIGS